MRNQSKIAQKAGVSSSDVKVTCTKTTAQCLAPGASTAGAATPFEYGGAGGILSFIFYGLLTFAQTAADITPLIDRENEPVYYNATMELPSAANLSVSLIMRRSYISTVRILRIFWST